MPDKILVTNYSALKSKYGPKGLKAVLDAVSLMMAADKDRGLSTQIVNMSDPAKMKKYKGAAVTKPTNERQCKDAVDAIYGVAKPDYLVILDGPDVVPHLRLTNPTPGDKDKDVPSDLPYASDAPFTKRDAAAYAAVTRVVGRIPGITGAKDADFLVKLIKTAANFKTRKRNDYLPHFAISAEVWRESTEESVDNTFGSKTIKTCPPTGTAGVGRLLSPLMHFINCHGGESDPQFYGQRGGQYPVSMTSDNVARYASRNTIVAAECCFGAQLYDPVFADGKWPIPNAYLNAGAVGYFGSTTIAYGPPEGNGAADLLTQYFLIDVLAAASLGRACLQARQKFVLSQKMEDPVNLKTLAQFILLGDPSLQACLSDQADAKAMSKVIDQSAARETRRVFLFAAGKSAAESSGFPGKKLARPPKGLHNLVQKIARQKGIRASRSNIEAFNIVGGADYGKEMKARGVQQEVVVVTDHKEPPRKKAGRRSKALPVTRILVAHAQDNRVIEVAEYIRR
jgi:Peptidase family C25